MQSTLVILLFILVKVYAGSTDPVQQFCYFGCLGKVLNIFSKFKIGFKNSDCTRESGREYQNSQWKMIHCKYLSDVYMSNMGNPLST